ncbi:MAG: hypothetical protein PHI29_00795 [Gallionella sp.]|nr:hypothetical protein [Gallionella sp.]
MSATNDTECPYCNGDGHHRNMICIKCDGTGKYKPASSRHKPKESGANKFAAIWVGFILVILLFVIASAYLNEHRLEQTAIKIIFSSVAWLFIFKTAQVIWSNSKLPPQDRLVLVDPNSSALKNILILSVMIIAATITILWATLPIKWFINFIG